jgi:hypothetical protein
MATGTDAKNRAATGKSAGFVVQRGDVELVLDIDPREKKSLDDRFTLSSTDGSFSRTLTVADDASPDNEQVELKFEGLDMQLRYTLEVDPGKEGSPYKVFEDRPFDELADHGGGSTSPATSEATPPMDSPSSSVVAAGGAKNDVMDGGIGIPDPPSEEAAEDGPGDQDENRDDIPSEVESPFPDIHQQGRG